MIYIRVQIRKDTITDPYTDSGGQLISDPDPHYCLPGFGSKIIHDSADWTVLASSGPSDSQPTGASQSSAANLTETSP